MTGFPKHVRDIITRRCQGVCERCGAAPAVQFHHRRPRGMGGSTAPDTNTASNGLGLCEPCHREIETNRADSLKYGWLVRQGREPFLVPMFRRGEWVTLYDNGSITKREDNQWVG